MYFQVRVCSMCNYLRILCMSYICTHIYVCMYTHIYAYISIIPSLDVLSDPLHTPVELILLASVCASLHTIRAAERSMNEGLFP